MNPGPSEPVIPLRFQPGDTLVIRGADAGIDLWQVVQRKFSGWLLKPLDGGDPRTWTDHEINDTYRARGLVHRPCNIANLSKAAAQAMERTWEFWKPAVRREAERRLAYVLAADALVGEGWIRLEAYAAAADRVHAENAADWTLENRDAIVAAHAVESKRPRRRKRLPEPDVGESSIRHEKPGPYTLRLWYQAWALNGRDIRLLLPRYDLRGNRIPRFTVATAEGAWDTYRCMEAAIRDDYLRAPSHRKDYAYGKYKELCATHRVAEVVKPSTFRNFLKKLIGAREEFAARFGHRAAYLRFGIFHRTKLPDRPLEEVEVDHCLLDIFAVHPVTGKSLGRPWLTVIIDRATKVILGVHLSFTPPSYATLMRAMAHAMWPKDLTGIAGLLHGWPCHGLWDMLFTDNGKEFHSKSLNLSAAMLKFTVVPLPVKHPWLKGTIERLWRRMGVQVYSLQEGSTLSRVPDHYDPVERATMTLDGIKTITLRWIVNEYHHDIHATLKCTPMQKWLELVSLYPVRPVPDFEDVIRLTGEVRMCKIGNVGVLIDGLLYVDVDPATGGFGRKLAELRARRGGLERFWTVRFDPFDIGEVWLLDDEAGEWIHLPCTEQLITNGVSRWAHKLHKAIAVRSVEPGVPVTTADLEDAKAFAEQEAQAVLAAKGSIGATSRAARYTGDQGYFTPMPFPKHAAFNVPGAEEPPAPVAAAAPPMHVTAPQPAPDPVPTAEHAPEAGPAPQPAPKGPPVDFEKMMLEELQTWE